MRKTIHVRMRRSRRTRKGGDHKTHYQNINVLINKYMLYLFLERDKMNYSFNADDEKYKLELQTIIDIFENPNTPLKTKEKIVLMAMGASKQAQNEKKAVKNLLNSMRKNHLTKKQEEQNSNEWSFKTRPRSNGISRKSTVY